MLRAKLKLSNSENEWSELRGWNDYEDVAFIDKVGVFGPSFTARWEAERDEDRCDIDLGESPKQVLKVRQRRQAALQRPKTCRSGGLFTV